MTVETRLRRPGVYDVYVAPTGRQRKGRIYRENAETPEAAAESVRRKLAAYEATRIRIETRRAGIEIPFGSPDGDDERTFEDWLADGYAVDRVETRREPEYVDVDVDRARRIAEANRARAKDRRIR